MSAERYNSIKNQIETGDYLSDSQRRGFQQDFSKIKGHYGVGQLEDTYTVFEKRLADAKRLNAQNREAISEQYKLMSNDVNSRLQKTIAQSFAGSSDVQKMFGGVTTSAPSVENPLTGIRRNVDIKSLSGK